MSNILKKLFRNYHTKTEYKNMANEFHFYISLIAKILGGMYEKESIKGKTPKELDKAEKDIIRLHFVLCDCNKKYSEKNGFTVDNMREHLTEEILKDLMCEAKIFQMFVEGKVPLRFKRRKELRNLYYEYKELTDFSVFN